MFGFVQELRDRVQAIIAEKQARRVAEWMTAASSLAKSEGIAVAMWEYQPDGAPRHKGGLENASDAALGVFAREAISILGRRSAHSTAARQELHQLGGSVDSSLLNNASDATLGWFARHSLAILYGRLGRSPGAVGEVLRVAAEADQRAREMKSGAGQAPGAPSPAPDGAPKDPPSASCACGSPATPQGTCALWGCAKQRHTPIPDLGDPIPDEWNLR